MLLKKQVGKRHENICVFYKQQPTYNPQMVEGKPSHGTGNNVGKVQGKREYLGVSNFKIQEVEKSNLKYPTSVVKFNGMGRGLAVHPTQKPVALMEYLIKTYKQTKMKLCWILQQDHFQQALHVLIQDVVLSVSKKDENYFNTGVNRIKEII